jgi:hypothetical protein
VQASLYGYSVNVDGTVTDILADPWTPSPVPVGVDVSLFDSVSGLGSITAEITGAGDHTFDAFFDHEIVETVNTFFNESGAANNLGDLAFGQSWEIDEPGWVFGDIYDNFANSALDGTNNVLAGSEDDVSMAMGWDFTLTDGESAIIQAGFDGGPRAMQGGAAAGARVFDVDHGDFVETVHGEGYLAAN